MPEPAKSSLPRDLESCEVKLARARLHLDSLKREAGDVVNENKKLIRREIDSQRHEQVITFKGSSYLGMELGAIVGDIGHNLRSALDSLVFALARLGGGDPEEERTEFPIAESEGEYLRKRGDVTYRDRCLAGLKEDHRKRIDAVQPYNEGPHTDALRVLNAISNRDKHRVVHPAFAAFLRENGEWITAAQFGGANVKEFHFSLSLPPDADAEALAHPKFIIEQVYVGMEKPRLGVVFFPKPLEPGRKVDANWVFTVDRITAVGVNVEEIVNSFASEFPTPP